MKRLIPATVLLAVALTGCMVAGPANVTGSASLSTGGALDPNATPNPNRKVVRLIVPSSDVVINENDSLEVSLASVEYSDGTKDGNVVFAVSDNRIASISNDGKFTGLAEGQTTVTVKAANDPSKMAVVNVTVRKGKVQAVLVDVTPASATLKRGETVQLSARVQSSDGTNNANLTYKSSNETVALVGATGLVTARAPGKATITVTSKLDATVKAESVITVEGDAAASN